MRSWQVLFLAWAWAVFGLPATAAEDARGAGYAGLAVGFLEPAAEGKWPTLQGAGLEVVDLDPDGPSAAAGVRRSDILVQWDDQLLFTPGQLRALVRTLAPGSAHKLQILREGVVQILELQLGAPESGTNILRELRVARVPFERWNADPEWPAELENLSAGEPGEMDEDMVREMPKWLAELLVDSVETKADTLEWIVLLQGKSNPATAGPATLAGLGEPRTFAAPEPPVPLGMVDDQGSVEVRQRGGRTFAVVRDAQGSVLYEGPLESKEHFLLLRPLRPGLREIVEKSVSPDRVPLPPVEVEIWRTTLPPRIF